jgi:CheY-like chemotaxis protein
MHQGTVGVTSQGEGFGSTFYFEIPVIYNPLMTLEPTTERERGFSSLEKSLVQREISTNVVFGQKKFLKNQHALLLSSPQCLLSSENPPSTAPSPPLTSVKIVDIPTDAPFTTVTRDEEDSKSEVTNGTATTRPAGSTTSNTGPVEVIVKTTDDAGHFVSLAVRSDSGANLQSLPFENARKLRVLIADDSGLSRKMIERALVPLDMICIHAKDGRDAVEKILESMKDSQEEESELDVAAAVVPSSSSSQKKGNKIPTTATATTPSPRQRVSTSSSSAPPKEEEEPDKSDKKIHSNSTTPHGLSLSSSRLLFTSEQQQHNLQRRIDVVIIDFMMPELDGASAIKAMRDANYEGFICAVTGSSAAMDYEKLTKSGSSIIMTKPFDVKAFYSCLKGNFSLYFFFFLLCSVSNHFFLYETQIFIVISGILGPLFPSRCFLFLNRFTEKKEEQIIN